MVGREERIRTSDPSVPNAVLYQTEPLPEFIVFPLFLPTVTITFFLCLLSPVVTQWSQHLKQLKIKQPALLYTGCCIMSLL